MSRNRNFILTINNPESPPEFSDAVQYAAYQLEEGTLGTKHYQLYVEFKERMTIKAVSALFPRAHIEARKGTQKQAIDYCTKDDTRVSGEVPHYYGEKKAQGQRTDLARIVESISSGNSFVDVATKHPVEFIKYSTGIAKLFSVMNQPVHRPTPEIEYVWGPPRVGKSKYAHDKYPNAYVMTDHPNAWMDGYNGEEEIIIDEFAGAIPHTTLCRLLDRYKLSMPVKGGMVPIRAYKFIITSNFDPLSVLREAVLARIKEFGKITYMGGLGAQPPYNPFQAPQGGAEGQSPPDCPRFF